MTTEQDQRNRAMLLSRITAVILAALLIAFFATTVYNMSTISSQVASIKTGPYPVSVAAGRVETLLVQMHTLVERPAHTQEANAPLVKTVSPTYESIDTSMSENVAFILQNYHANPQDAQALHEGYEELRKCQAVYLRMYSDSSITREDMNAYAQEHTYPLIDQLLDLDIAILDESNEAVDEAY